ncbi:subtilisin family serine protease [Labrenzia sp. EL_208]|nr:subtilisin family serine protease [Labrenzia sp. EL_132]MBG6228153.1 subtilisin family serine protease [Labrenzia sp. EL_208]
MRFIISTFSIFFLFASSTLAQQSGSEPSSALLPSPDQQAAFEAFSRNAPHNPRLHERFGTTYFGLAVPKNELPPDSLFSTDDENQFLERPVAALAQLNLQFTQSASIDEITGILDQFQLQVVDVDPRIGMWTVNALDSDTISLTFDDTRASAPTNDSLENLLKQLRENPLITAAARNPYLTPNILRDAAVPRFATPTFGTSTEDEGWGIADANISSFWPLIDTTPVKVGILDAGFADHDDITFIDGLTHNVPVNNHGNHVAGIACAGHNGFGIKGVLPNCVVVRASPRFVLDQFERIEGSPLARWNALFSEVASTVLDFIDENPDTRVLNLSLGYNWMPNFGADPQEPQNLDIRNEVRELGRFHASVLAFAKKKNVVIVSAAGNDSSTLAQRLDARWASPFNFGSKLVEQLDGWTNGVIVEAHDKKRDISVFSNGGGHISAPGVDINSALASAPNSYGMLSGTSMASPFVSGVVAGLQELFPSLATRSIVTCLLSSQSLSSNGTKILDADAAVAACRSM